MRSERFSIDGLSTRHLGIFMLTPAIEFKHTKRYKWNSYGPSGHEIFERRFAIGFGWIFWTVHISLYWMPE